MLKKQTVWLLTMLSLVVVLSVYYVTSPQQQISEEFAATEQAQDEQAEAMPAEATKTEATENNEQPAEQSSGIETVVEEVQEGDSVASSVSTDDLFTSLRMELDDQRSKMKEELQAVVASTNVTAEKRSEALDKIEQINEVSNKEAILETMIKANEKYSDVLVKTNEDEVKVIVKATKKSEASANELMQMVRDEMGINKVAVEFQAVE
ncbi:SpoIIIAH-like family protein [Bacillus tianshenii]|nr:SpoIIIAH-like family protein [Bacillus tianshenii]